MAEYNKVNIKLSDSQLNKLKTAVNNWKQQMNIKMFNGNNSLHELLSNYYYYYYYLLLLLVLL